MARDLLFGSIYHRAAARKFHDVSGCINWNLCGWGAFSPITTIKERIIYFMRMTSGVLKRIPILTIQDFNIGGVNQKSYGYDSAGRTTSVVSGAGTTTLAYDYEGRISQITHPSTATNTFTYNGLDTRVGKVDSAGTSTYKRDGAGVTARF